MRFPPISSMLTSEKFNWVGIQLGRRPEKYPWLPSSKAVRQRLVGSVYGLGSPYSEQLAENLETVELKDGERRLGAQVQTIDP